MKNHLDLSAYGRTTLKWNFEIQNVRSDVCRMIVMIILCWT